MSQSKARLAEVLAPVQEGMERMRAVLAEQLQDSSLAVRDMTDHVDRFHGKQLRAALVLLTGEATGNTTDEHVRVAAIVARYSGAGEGKPVEVELRRGAETHRLRGVAATEHEVARARI